MNTDSKLYQSIANLALATAVLLLMPLLAMHFTEEVVWTLSDFIVAGVLLFGTGFTYKMVTRKAGDIAYRVAVGCSLATGLVLIWVNLAVGIAGAEDNPANLMYFGVPVVGIIGAIVSRVHPKGMALTLVATAFAQALIVVIVLAGGMYQSPPSSVMEILMVNGFFVSLFVVSALLFRYAAEERNASDPEPTS